MKHLYLFVSIAIILTLVGCGNEQTAEEKNSIQDAMVASIQNATVLPISFDQLSSVFLLGSDNTDLQRDAVEKEIIGKVVQWDIPIYEISLQDDGVYAVTTESNYGGKSHLTASVFITARNSKDREYLASLKSGDVISFKGTLSAINLRLQVTVSPAILN